MALEASGLVLVGVTGCNPWRELKHHPLGQYKRQQAQELGFPVKVFKLAILSSAQGGGNLTKVDLVAVQSLNVSESL